MSFIYKERQGESVSEGPWTTIVREKYCFSLDYFQMTALLKWQQTYDTSALCRQELLKLTGRPSALNFSPYARVSVFCRCSEATLCRCLITRVALGKSRGRDEGGGNPRVEVTAVFSTLQTATEGATSVSDRSDVNRLFILHCNYSKCKGDKGLAHKRCINVSLHDSSRLVNLESKGFQIKTVENGEKRHKKVSKEVLKSGHHQVINEKTEVNGRWSDGVTKSWMESV